jgi:hypothetical protein
MPIVENPDGTLWIDINKMSEVDAVRTRLTELDKRVTALIPDPSFGITVEEVDWVDLYPKIVPRNGPEPGIIVEPAEIPNGHTLLLAAHTLRGVPRGREVVLVLSLIRGSPPQCVGKVIGPQRPMPPSDSRLRPARPPRPDS